MRGSKIGLGGEGFENICYKLAILDGKIGKKRRQIRAPESYITETTNMAEL